MSDYDFECQEIYRNLRLILRCKQKKLAFDFRRLQIRERDDFAWNIMITGSHFNQCRQF